MLRNWSDGTELLGGYIGKNPDAFVMKRVDVTKFYYFILKPK